MLLLATALAQESSSWMRYRPRSSDRSCRSHGCCWWAWAPPTMEGNTGGCPEKVECDEKDCVDADREEGEWERDGVSPRIIPGIFSLCRQSIDCNSSAVASAIPILSNHVERDLNPTDCHSQAQPPVIKVECILLDPPTGARCVYIFYVLNQKLKKP